MTLFEAAWLIKGRVHKKRMSFHPSFFVHFISYLKLILRPELQELRAQPSCRPSLLLYLSLLSLLS